MDCRRWGHGDASGGTGESFGDSGNEESAQALGKLRTGPVAPSLTLNCLSVPSAL